MLHKHKKLFLLSGAIFAILTLILAANIYMSNNPSTQNTQQAYKKQIVPWSYKKLGITKMWKFTRGKNVKIVILDSGIDLNHPDLKSANIIKTINFIEPNKPASDETGHGIFITGIITAQNNNFGIIGIAPEAEIFILKILNKIKVYDVDNKIKIAETEFEGYKYIATLDKDTNEIKLKVKPTKTKKFDKSLDSSSLDEERNTVAFNIKPKVKSFG